MTPRHIRPSLALSSLIFLVCSIGVLSIHDYHLENCKNFPPALSEGEEITIDTNFDSKGSMAVFRLLSQVLRQYFAGFFKTEE